ncbi:PTS sugar transporter subunit IIA [Sporanaerobacter acetigenes]|uniref:PTS sugar transporter subunit IIA n=1 Tax=Sporanaerobacter acetigenes TaxID=165813 RepID=UPI00331FC90A
MSTKIIVTSHGELAKYTVKTLELILGDLDNIDYLCLGESEGLESYKKRLEDKISDDDNYIILADIIGGTPSNAAYILKQHFNNVEVIVSFNLPLIISLLQSVVTSGDNVVESAIDCGREMIKTL